jgi:beta-lactamase regulating signal transducer with metallopeptidase domain
MEAINGSLLTFLFNSVWQVPLVATVAALACWLMRSSPARNRHTVWVAALIMGILLPLASTRDKEQPSTPRSAVPAPSPGAPLAEGAPHLRAPAPPAPSPASPFRTVSLTETAAKLLLGVYGLLIFLRLVGLARAALSTVRIRRSADAVALPGQLERVHRRCEQVFGLAGVRLLFSPDVPCPVTVGHSIILPKALLTEPSEDVLTTAIGHEMAHVARRDFLCNILFELLSAPVSFQPAASLIRRGIQRNREIACDELVTGHLTDAQRYASAMVGIAASMRALPRPGYTLGVFDGDALEDRVRRLVGQRTAGFRRSRLLLVTGLSALAVCAVIASSLALTARAQGFASGAIENGEAAYRCGDYKEAAQHFGSAVRLEPANLKARLLLATALSAEAMPGRDASGSSLVAAARQQYLDVLARDPGNQQALNGMISSYLSARQFDEAHEWALKAIARDGANKSAYYTAGFADWAMVWPEYASTAQAAGLIPDEEVRQSLRTRHMARIEDGIQMMSAALQLDPGFSEAMEYAGALCNMKAAIADSDGQSADLIAQAEDWARRASEAGSRRAPVTPLPPPPPPPPGLRGTTSPPKLLREARIFIPTEVLKSNSGLVQLGVVIAKDGTVRHIDVVSGPPALAAPLINAVRNYVYEPTLVNGEPAEVRTMVNFKIVSPFQ